MSSKEELKSLDVFQESALRVLKSSPAAVENIKDENESEDLIIPYGEVTNWTDLKRELKTTHALRFNHILKQLPAREFMRTYLKLLEFVEPKITRQTGMGGTEEDTELNIHVKRSGGN